MPQSLHKKMYRHFGFEVEEDDKTMN